MSVDISTSRARAWSIRRDDGFRLGFTDHDEVLHFEGLDYRPKTGMEAKTIMQSTGLSVDNSEAVGLLSDDAITEVDLRAGRWDGAQIRLWEVDWTDLSDRKLLFRGSLGEVVSGGGSFRAELRGLTEVLNQPQGRVYHPRCSAVLGDGDCRVDLARPGFTIKAVLKKLDEGGSWIVEVEDDHDAGWFDHGRLVLLEGDAAGLEGVIRKDLPLGDNLRKLSFWQTPSLLPQIGEAVSMVAGCSKAAETCRMKFANFLNFRGFPHLPPEDWLLAPHLHAVSGPSGA